MIKLAPSILAADFNKLGEQIAEVERAGAEYLHIDVMDGMFVPSISFGMPVIASIRKNSKLFFDCHLMINEPVRYIADFKAAGADAITVHYEACSDLVATLKAIREAGLKVGVSINPGTPVSALSDEVCRMADMILIMSVNPGFGGQKYIEASYSRLSELRERLDALGLSTDIEVDGGVGFDNLEAIIRAGANVIVSGSTIFKGDIVSNVRRFREISRTASK